MRLKLAFALMILIAATTAAPAQKLSGIGANLFGSYFAFAKANLQQAPVSTIKIGSFQAKLQDTKLAELHKRFGGTIMANGGASWLCYHADGTNSWFMSNDLGGQEFVMMIAVEASARMPDGCEAPSDSFVVPDLGIPGLGAPSADLKATFGAASGNKISYRHDRPGGYADIAQYIGYMMKSGKVVGYGVGETSVPTAH